MTTTNTDPIAPAKVTVTINPDAPLSPSTTYRWATTLWKGIRPALTVAGVAAVGVFLNQLDASVLVKMGLSQVLATFLIEAARNWWKQRALRSN